MKKEHRAILSLIERRLEANPNLRFAQVLFNLGINEFADEGNPEKEKYQLRDIYNDSDSDVLLRALHSG